MTILKKSGDVVTTLRRAAASCVALRASKRGSTAVFVAVAVPALILLGGLSVDQSYVTMRQSMLRRTAQSAAFAAQQNLNNPNTTPQQAAMTNAAANMGSQYGTVVQSANVVLGTWASPVFTPTTVNPTAVKVTALNTAANSNPVNTFFGGSFGKPTVDLSTYAVVGYGTGKAFNTIILNDLSMSFSSEVSDQRAADLQILNCVAGASSTTSQVGLVGFTGHSSALYALGNAVTNLPAMTTYVNNTLKYCGNTGMPACSGSNVASGLYSAIAQLQTAGLANKGSNIILITDGVPNADAITYAAADGTSPTTLGTPSGWAGCTKSCSDANLWTAAQAQSLYAASLGINISTVYYSGDTTGSGNVTTYANDLATLRTGTGINLVAPTAAQIDASFGAFCASMGSVLKKVQ
jgi:Flp pilus assembly protein TadG